jgi:hypothetical protein
MAATEKQQPILLSTGDGAAPEIITAKIAASQGIFMPGAPCYISTSGTVKLSDTSDGTGDTHHGFIVGVEDKSTAWPLTAELSANDKVRVQLIRAGDRYVAYLEDNDSDSAATQSDVGNQYGVRVATGAGKIGYMTVDANNSNGAVLVRDIYSNLDPETETTSTSPGRVVVEFLPSVIDATRA